MRPLLVSAVVCSFILVRGPGVAAASGGPVEKARPRSGSPPGGDPAEPVLQDLLAAHNKVRAEEKRAPLKLNPQLTEAARGHARDMADHDKLSHEGSDGSDSKTRIKRAGYHYKEIGENVAASQATVGEAMQSWLESPPHRANILGDFTEMGGAVATGPDGRKFWCVDFGRPMPAVDPAKSPGEMIDALNKARTEAGKKKLRGDSQLARVAARFARDAAGRQKLEVKDRDGNTPFKVLEGEGYRARRFATTLALGEGDPTAVVAAWLKEPKDREALMSGFERVGVGVATDSEGVPYWVLLMAQGVSR